MTKHDGFNWHAFAHVDKFSPKVVRDLTETLGYEPTAADFRRLSVDASSVAEADGNLLTTVGLARVTNLITGGGGVAMTHANMACGVGDTSTAAAIGDTQLGSNSANHSRYLPVDSTYPTVANGLITAVTTFTTSDANYAWQEWGWVVGTTTTASDTFAGSATSPTLLNHKIASLGTKVSGAVWVFTTTVTLS